MFIKSIYNSNFNKKYIPTIISDNLKAITSEIDDIELKINDNLFSIALVNLTKEIYKKEFKKYDISMSYANYSFDEMSYKGKENQFLDVEKNKAHKKNYNIEGIKIIDDVSIDDLNDCAEILNEVLIDEINTQNILKNKNKYLYYGIKYLIDNGYDTYLNINSIPKFIATYYNKISVKYEDLFIENAKNAYYLRDPYNKLLKVPGFVSFEKNIEELKKNKLSNYLNPFIVKANEFITNFNRNNLSYDLIYDIVSDAYIDLCNDFIADVLNDKITMKEIENDSILFNRVDDLDILIGYINR